MKQSMSPVAATVVAAAAAGALLAVTTTLPLSWAYRAAAVNAAIFVSLAAYTMLLARLSQKRLRALFAPLFMLSAVLASAGSVGAFVIPAAACLAWIRSGICFQGSFGRRVITEAVIGPAGLSLAWLLPPPGTYGWALGIWVFGLTQAFYFVVFDFERSGLQEPAVQARSGQTEDLKAALRRERKLELAFEELGLSGRARSGT